MKRNRFLLTIVSAVLTMLPLNVLAMEISVDTPTGNGFTIEVESSDTIEAIKEKIFNRNNNYPVDKQRLYYNDTEMQNGRTFDDYYSSSLDSIVKMELVVNVVLNANGGLFTDKEEYVIEDIYGSSDSDIVIPTREGYVFKGFYTEKDGGINREYYAENHVIENETVFYAHWDKIGTATLDFTKIINSNNFTAFEIDLLKILDDNKILLEDQTNTAVTNKNGKILIKVDEEGNIITSEGLTSDDNIVYTLSEADKQLLLNKYDQSYVPNVINIIVAEEKEYKVIFDANGGTFKNGNILTVEKWSNGLENSLEEPTREGYKFLGYFSEKTGGTKFELILAESGIDNDMTFYAQWEENSVAPSNTEEENPKTFDGIGTSIFMGTISLIGLAGATIYLKKQNKVRA